ncbi:SRPBCC family protein [Lapillicoccus jejuensis]|uniref:SRPBCC family protein n=1 Tax=Lapillicoccus jejuensis TaxID=402171 RepID=UPI001FE40B83|nr:SRPBCC family protein [Lapillicoccus jejuensis]
MAPLPGAERGPHRAAHRTTVDHRSDGRHVVRRTVHAPPEAVWAVLADGWLYTAWVVGASRMRDVEDSWPAVGAKLHHSFGVWPAVLDDETQVVESEPQQLLRLIARGRPAGEAEVVVRLEALGADRTQVSIVEDVASGPGKVVPVAVRQPPIALRNSEALYRLALLAEGRWSGVSPETAENA